MVTGQYKRDLELPADQFAADRRDFTPELAQSQVMLVLLMVASSSVLLLAHNASVPLDCEDVYNLKMSLNSSATVRSGVYTIYPAGTSNPVRVYCDMGCMENGGHQDEKWTVIQRRFNGNVSFYRPWEHYKHGFGDAKNEYWLGLKYVYQMTNTEKYQLRVYMEDFENGSAYAQYMTFFLGPESSNYVLNIGGYINGGAGDSLSYANGKEFATFDRDPTGSCADTYGGGFWYYGYWWRCHYANPNGLYKYGNVGTAYTGIMWQSWKGDYYSLKSIVMKIRRIELEDLTNT